jgi:transposase
MAFIRQSYLFSLQDMMEMDQENRFEAIFNCIDITPLVKVVFPKHHYGPGAPVRNDHAAMLYSLFARIIERIPTVKDLVRRLKHDALFRWSCGFDLGQPVPSEASYSRMMAKLSAHPHVLQDVQQQLIQRVMQEGFLSEDTIAIDSTHIEARERAPFARTKDVAPKQKRGRKPKAEREALLAEKAALLASRPLYEQEIVAQLEAPLDILVQEMPTTPQWGCKKNSETQQMYWYGYKLHLLVGTQNQYILGSMISSANLNDGKAAIPLLKQFQQCYPDFKLAFATMDAGYDHEPIYRQLHKMKISGIIAYNRRREPSPIGCDEHFAPVCIKQHSYRYDSYDSTYETIKYTEPKECSTCPFATQGECQKVYKIKITDDLRRYCAPARGSAKWKLIYKRRTAVERVNAYLKQFFGIENIRYRTGKRAKMQMDMTTLVYNALCLAKDRLNQQLQEGVAV